MRKLSGFFLLIIFLFVCLYHKQIVNYIMVNHIYKKSIVVHNSNNYKREYKFSFISSTENFIIKNKQDTLNVVYTILNNGWDNFTFYCDDNYIACIDDTKDIISDVSLLSNINNFVHPYNSYDSLFINYNSFGKISLSVNKLYNKDDIEEINEKVDLIMDDVINNKMSDIDKIKAIHDYIINTTKYDTQRAYNIRENIPLHNSLYDSHKALGPLIQNMAICSGYSDAMAIFLNELGIENYKISNDNHVWNLVKLNNKWYHLDLTWDDPIVNTNEDILLHAYFLITTEELKKQDPVEHNFNKNIYLEAK